MLEYQADAFAVGLGKETAENLKTALIGIHEKNLVSFPFYYLAVAKELG